MSAACKSCGDPIDWVEMPSGKRMPIDAHPQKMIELSADGQRGRVITVHSSHFFTCPNADQHRRKGGAS